MEENINITFTREELTVLNNILDHLTKLEGLKVAETTVYLSKKITAVLQIKPS